MHTRDLFAEWANRSYDFRGVEVSVVAERVQYYDKDGKLITESLRDYTKGAVQEHYTRLDDFLQRWSEARVSKSGH